MLQCKIVCKKHYDDGICCSIFKQFICMICSDKTMAYGPQKYSSMSDEHQHMNLSNDLLLYVLLQNVVVVV